MGELGYTMWMELSSPPLPLAELKFFWVMLSILWAAFQYFLFYRLDRLCRSDSRVHAQIVCLEGPEQVGSLQEPPYAATKALGQEGVLEPLSDFEHYPGLWEALPNLFSPKEGTTDDVAPRSPY